MTAKFLKYWGAGKVPLLYGFGAILDVRCKIGGLNFFLKYIRNHFVDQDYVALDLPRIVQAFFDLFKVYEAKLLPQYRAQPSQSQTQYPRRHQYTNVFVNAPAYSPSPQQQEAGTSQTRSSATDARSHPEIQEYDRNEWVKPDDEAIDLLVWWRQNARRFPVLSSMAQDILTIPVSTVSSEAAFSSAGRIIDDRRCSLKPEMVEALTCGKDWIQHRNRAQETFMCFDILDDFEVDFANVNING